MEYLELNRKFRAYNSIIQTKLRFTEIWNDDFSLGNETAPNLPAGNYERISLLLVDEGFCQKER